MSDKLQQVVNYFLSCANDSRGVRVITNKKLQKLLYYAQAWNLVFNEKKLFEEEIEAWIHGPVVPVVYTEFKEFGRLPIVRDVECNEDMFTRAELKTLREVWSVYGKFDGDYLEILSHSEDPWIIARGTAEANESSSAIITPESMKEYYTNKNK